MSSFKNTNLRVVSTIGAGSALGDIVPEVGMPTNLGYISSTYNPSGIVIVGATGDPSGYYNIYSNQLQITSGDAASAYGWPTGVNCTQYGHGTDNTNFGAAAKDNLIWMLTSSGNIGYKR